MTPTLFQPYKFGITMTTNGRQSLMTRAIASLRANVMQHWKFDHMVVVDDSGEQGNFELLHDLLPEFTVIRHPENRGLAAAVQQVWAMTPSNIDFVFHMEDDFIFNSIPDLSSMTKLLLKYPELWQVVLKRQPVSYEEMVAGGYIEMAPQDYEQRESDISWLKHQKFFSLNPCLIPKNIFHTVGWPDGNEAEMTQRMIRADGYSAIYGHKNDAPILNHIGNYRSISWKL